MRPLPSSSDDGAGDGLSDPAGAPREVASLIALYKSANGESWVRKKKWKILDDAARSHGLDQCHGVHMKDGHVIKLDLRSNRLTGTCERASRPAHGRMGGGLIDACVQAS